MQDECVRGSASGRHALAVGGHRGELAGEPKDETIDAFVGGEEVGAEPDDCDPDAFAFRENERLPRLFGQRPVARYGLTETLILCAARHDGPRTAGTMIWRVWFAAASCRYWPVSITCRYQRRPPRVTIMAAAIT